MFASTAPLIEGSYKGEFNLDWKTSVDDFNKLDLPEDDANEVQRTFFYLTTINLDQLEPQQMILFDQIEQYLKDEKIVNFLKHFMPHQLFVYLIHLLAHRKKFVNEEKGTKILYSHDGREFLTCSTRRRIRRKG